ncbi:MAG: AbrB/MazE/SpoVT family DNA-binding domain-containing protein [Bryobacteraceae bacterium]|jgi:AbrB family looped-hinge helix DNA binding protein
MVIASKVTTKGQVTIPKEVRERLRIQAGDMLVYEFQDGLVVVRKMEPFDAGWHRALSPTLADEWNSPEDDEAFGDL